MQIYPKERIKKKIRSIHKRELRRKSKVFTVDVEI